MHKDDLQEIIDLSTRLEKDLDGFIGHFNDELTRANIKYLLREYFVRIRAITRLPIDINKVGICNISKIAPTIGADFGIRSDQTENEIRANEYTVSLFRDITRLISDNQVPS